MKLREYQTEAVETVFEFLHVHREPEAAPVCALPTGTGKSLVIGGLNARAVRTYPGTRTINLTHVKELVEQNASKLGIFAPDIPYGVYSAGLKSKDTLDDVIFGSVQSVCKKLELFGRRDIALVDECHLIGPSDEAIYQKSIAAFREINPYLRLCGFTATDYRLGQGLLTDEGIFTHVAYDRTGLAEFNWFIEQGYLAPLITKRTAFEFDVSDVGLSKGEFAPGELANAIDKADINYAALRETCELGFNRRSWLLFASSIEHAEHVAGMLQSFGINAAAVHSRQKPKERDAIIAAYKSGQLRAIVNKDILTTGFDDPKTDLIVMLRPTMSPGLWVQMLGRGTRPHYADGHDLDTQAGRLAAIHYSDKQNCLVLDFAGNTKRLGPINDPVKPRKKGQGGGGEAPVRICEACGCYNHASARVCAVCGQEFPAATKLSDHASAEEVIRSDVPEYVDYDVTRVFYGLHAKISGPPSVRVEYVCGLQSFSEYICFEHGGFAGKKARDWWRARDTSGSEPPATCAEALDRIAILAVPRRISVIVNRKYPEIVKHYYV